jgi:hypothetical protein
MIRPPALRSAALASAGVLLVVLTPSQAETQTPQSPQSRRVGIPLVCSRGPSGQRHDVAITAPAGVASGSRYIVRVDGVDTGKISHIGLHYIFDMQSQWLIPKGTEYVDGSARIVPGTGSPAVRPGARVVYRSGTVTLVLPAHVDNGSSYTPPSFEFELAVNAPAGTVLTQSFATYRVMANAFLVGDLETSCDPTPKPFAVAQTRVEPNP